MTQSTHVPLNQDDEDPDVTALLSEMADQSEKTNQQYQDYLKSRKKTFIEKLFLSEKTGC